jgi:hypothetical protein
LSSIKAFAPVLIITLNRFSHFERCVSSLARCLYADQTDLYIALDYPARESHFKGYTEILKFIPTIKGFNSVVLIKRDKNFGIAKNYYDALDYVLSRHDRLLFSEDDNVFSTDYLNFMNQCLSVYEHDVRIFTVCGYNYPVAMPESYKEVEYIWSGHSAWGFGLWKHKWEQVNWADEEVFRNVSNFGRKPLQLKRYTRIANHYLDSLNTILKMKRANGDGYICMYQYVHNMYSVFPVESRVKNDGHDGSGNHCAIDEEQVYTNQQVYTGTHEYRIGGNAQINSAIFQNLRFFFRRSNYLLMKDYLKMLLLQLGLIR